MAQIQDLIEHLQKMVIDGTDSSMEVMFTAEDGEILPIELEDIDIIGWNNGVDEGEFICINSSFLGEVEIEGETDDLDELDELDAE